MHVKLGLQNSALRRFVSFSTLNIKLLLTLVTYYIINKYCEENSGWYIRIINFKAIKLEVYT